MGEPSIPVPPVDQSWSLMHSALDVRMPVTKAFYLRPRLWGGVVLGAAVTLIVFKVIFPHSHRVHTTKDAAAQSRPVMHSPSTVPFRPAATAARNADSSGGTNGSVTTPQSAAVSQAANLAQSTAAATRPTKPSTTSPLNMANSPQLTRARPPHPLANNQMIASPNPTLTRTNLHSPTNPGVAKTNSGAPGANPVTTSSPRQTYPLHLANLTSAATFARFRLADSLLRKRGLRPNGPVQKSAPTSPRNLTFSAGITVPEPFDLGQQRAAPYTINGGRNIWADYLPTAHVRAYSGDSWDLQLDLGLFRPQYTRSPVIDSTGGDSSSISPFQGYRQYNIYTVKKLFYSEASLSLHRQLYKGIWLGAGLIYGHLQGAVGDRQILMAATNPAVRDTIYNSEVVSIKTNDTAYNRLSRSDWRILLDAEYRYHRLTIGIRYQQALNSYLPVQADGSKGNQRNASFTFRGSFELWQRRR